MWFLKWFNYFHYIFHFFNAVVPDPKIFFWITASAADIPAKNLNGIKTFLGNGVSRLFIKGNPAFINGLRKLRNAPSWLVIFVVVPFKILLFSKDLNTFIILFISLFVRVIPKPVIYSLLNLSICLSRIFFPKSLAKSDPFLATLDRIYPKIGISRRVSLNCTISDNWVFENFVLVDEPFAKALRIVETCVSVNND